MGSGPCANRGRISAKFAARLGRGFVLSRPDMTAAPVPVEFSDPINARILAVSEDQVQGFQRDPLGEIARLSEVPLPTVIERLQAMLRAGNIRS